MRSRELLTNLLISFTLIYILALILAQLKFHLGEVGIRDDA